MTYLLLPRLPDISGHQLWPSAAPEGDWDAAQRQGDAVEEAFSKDAYAQQLDTELI